MRVLSITQGKTPSDYPPTFNDWSRAIFKPKNNMEDNINKDDKLLPTPIIPSSKPNEVIIPEIPLTEWQYAIKDCIKILAEECDIKMKKISTLDKDVQRKFGDNLTTAEIENKKRLKDLFAHPVANKYADRVLGDRETAIREADKAFDDEFKAQLATIATMRNKEDQTIYSDNLKSVLVEIKKRLKVLLLIISETVNEQ